MDVCIYQTFHKAYVRNLECDWIQPIGVGGYREPGWLSDDEGENISHLNPNYCELTAQYWVWKHRKHEFVGFYHYRRLLNFTIDRTWLGGPISKLPATPETIQYLTSPEQRDRLERLLTVAPVVIPRPVMTLPSIHGQYVSSIEPAPLNIMVGGLSMADDNKSRLVRPYFYEMTETPLCNMVVMRWDIFDGYCRDLFRTLSAVTKELAYPYDDYNNRYPGFLSERFLGYWLFAERIPTVAVPMMLLE